MLPGGHRAIYLPETPSTNFHAMALAQGGASGQLWVWAGRQTRGRGRLGRAWDSPKGNLYASLLLHPSCPPDAIAGLPLLAGLAAHDALTSEVADWRNLPALQLKWPNDILLGGAKLGGILIESAVLTSGARAVVIGTGLNLASAPADLGREVTCLHDHGCRVMPQKALSALAFAVARWLDVWADGAGIAYLRHAWLKRAHPLGAMVSVRLGNERIEGRFAGLDETGALLLRVGGAERRITAGDVAMARGSSGGNNLTAHHE